MEKESSNKVIIYSTEDGGTEIEVNLEDETVWLNQKQMAELFQKDIRTVNEHIRNLYKENELSKKSTIKAKTGISGFGLFKPTKYYNLDVIISAGNTFDLFKVSD